MTAFVLALTLSLFLAYSSVSIVWIPHGLSDDLFHEQNRLGEYAGTAPWSELSYPFSLSVYHTPFENLTLNVTYSYAYGQVRFSTLFAGMDIVQIKGTYGYYYPVLGSTPLQYNIDFLFSEPFQFFGYLLAFFTFFNFAGALIGFGLAYAIEKRRKPIEKTSNQRITRRVGEHAEEIRSHRMKVAALLSVVFIGLYLYLGVNVWNALLSSFDSVLGGLENILLFLFISWIGFGFLACYFLVLLMLRTLRKR